MLVLQLEVPGAAREQLDFERERASVEPTAFAADGQSDARADGERRELRDGCGVIDGDGAVGQAVREHRAQQAGAIAGRAAADVVRGFNDHGEARRDGEKFREHFVHGRLGDVAEFLGAECE